MSYVYILWSAKSNNFYYGQTDNLKYRIKAHNAGLSKSTAPYKPWKLVFYAALESAKLAKDFECYLKSGSGKAFAYKRLLNTAALKKNKYSVAPT
ncbi:MAG: GIY-YIG nuclease family protein [Planctomycetota bacterium]